MQGYLSGLLEEDAEGEFIDLDELCCLSEEPEQSFLSNFEVSSCLGNDEAELALVEIGVFSSLIIIFKIWLALFAS